MPDPHTNFGYSTVDTAPSPATSGTSLVVHAGDGVVFPSTGAFNATIWPAGAQPTTANAEIVRVTAISTDTFTITRAQESSSARTVVVGDQIAATITAKTLTDVELDHYSNTYLTTKDETIPANSEIVFSDFYELSAPFATELASSSELQLGTGSDIGSMFAPGYEFGYDQITANVNVTALTAVEATAPTTVIACSPHWFDGAPVMAEFYTGLLLTDTGAAGDSFIVSLYEQGTQLSRLGTRLTEAAGQGRLPFTGRYRFSPTRGFHTYTVGAVVSSTTGTPLVGAGAGGVTTNPPAYIRFTKV